MIRKIQFCLKTTIWIKNTLTKWGKTQIIQTSPTGRSMQNISIHSNEYGQFCCNTKEEHCDKSTICNGSCNNFQFNFLYKINYSLSLRNGFQCPCSHSLFPFFSISFFTIPRYPPYPYYLSVFHFEDMTPDIHFEHDVVVEDKWPFSWL